MTNDRRQRTEGRKIITKARKPENTKKKRGQIFCFDKGAPSSDEFGDEFEEDFEAGYPFVVTVK
jgi:hypothetical protein